MKRLETKKLSLAALLCALSAVVAVIGCVFDMADLTACTVASVTVAICAIELGGKYPYLVFAVTGAILFLFFPSATVTWYFIMFFGYYPIVKKYLDRLPKILARVLKFVLFNAAMFMLYFLMKKLLFAAEAEEGKSLLIMLVLFANVFFAVYDFSLSVFLTAYMKYYRKRWGIDKFMLK